MIHRLLLALLLALAIVCPAEAKVAAGKLDDLGVLHSRFTDERRVQVWLPTNYSRTGPPYAVLYMHDGQNLFDKADAPSGMEWRIDETLDRLIAENKVRPTIVVGIWSTAKRLREYVPSKAFTHFTADLHDRSAGSTAATLCPIGYLKFIVRELRPLIAAKYNVRTDRANTAIMGSSMGSLISLYAVDEYPKIFGAAGMVSTHWPLMVPAEGKTLSDKDFQEVSSAFERYLAPALPSPANHRLYFDYGSETLDAQYARYQKRIDRLVARRGYRPGLSWLTRSFPGQPHNEISWASRVEIPLRFLLPPRKTPHRR